MIHFSPRGRLPRMQHAQIGSKTSIEQRAAALVALVLMSAVSANAFGYFCEGAVEQVTVSLSVVVALNAPHAGIR
jgi:hypothetical protein